MSDLQIGQVFIKKMVYSILQEPSIDAVFVKYVNAFCDSDLTMSLDYNFILPQTVINRSYIQGALTSLCVQV